MAHLALCILFSNIAAVLSWWKPSPGTTWQWQLTNSDNINIDIDVDMYDIDLFDVSVETITALHEQGRKVICYFSAGSSETWRSDYDQFPSSVIGNPLDGWDGENWLNISAWNILSPIMTNRLDLAVTKRCDGVEADNVDGYQNDNGFSLTYNHQLTYNKHLSTEAHARNLSIGLKNDLDQINDLITYFDFAINEECNGYDECDVLKTFTQSNKAVFGAEYEMSVTQFCAATNDYNFDFLAKNWDLDVCVYRCSDFSCIPQ
eukprot:UN04932